MSNRRSKRVLPAAKVKPAEIMADSREVDSTFIFGNIIIEVEFRGLLGHGQLEFTGIPRSRSNLQPQHAHFYELEQSMRAPCGQELNLESGFIVQRIFHIESESLHSLPALFVS